MRGETVSTKEPVTIEHESPSTDVSVRFGSAIDQKRFAANLRRRKENRQTLIEWIGESLKSGVDYGRIHVVKKSICDRGRYCDQPSHFSKPSLWKPGAEKICGMLGMNVDFPSLNRYEEMALEGVEIKSIVLRCVLTTEDGLVLGSGIGARNVEQDDGDLNKALKMAAKSAHIDATLRAAGLSEVFTQDLETMYGDADATGVDPYTPGADPEHNAFSRSRRVNVETHCPIGERWRGKPWEEVETGFLQWIVDNIDDNKRLTDRVAVLLKDRQDRAAESAEPPGDIPHAKGSSELGKNARAIVMAESVAAIDKIYDSMPKNHKTPLKRTYEKRRAELVEQEGAS